MSTASLAASGRGAAVRIDRLFLGLALGATAILITLVLLDHQPASAALILGGFGLGQFTGLDLIDDLGATLFGLGDLVELARSAGCI